jgi:predicted flap endonuclease-1-like 5' DNA nuclease
MIPRRAARGSRHTKGEPMLRSTLLTVALLLAAAPFASASTYSIENVAGVIPQADADALKAAGVTTTEVLLEKAGPAKARKELAAATKIDEKKLRAYVDAADLLRVRGVGPKMVRLLGAVKIVTIADLKKQNGAKLAAALEKARPTLDADLKEKLPDKTTLADWIKQAKKLKAVVK